MRKWGDLNMWCTTVRKVWNYYHCARVANVYTMKPLTLDKNRVNPVNAGAKSAYGIKLQKFEIL